MNPMRNPFQRMIDIELSVGFFAGTVRCLVTPGRFNQNNKHVQYSKPMKKITITLALGALTALMPSISKATIVGSAHDFYGGSATNLWAAGTGPRAGSSGANVCGECHDVHKSVATASSGGSGTSSGPLWVHAPSANASSYILYSSAGSETFDSLGLTVKLGDSSIACLSCHDGTVGVNQKFTTAIDGTTTGTNTFLTGTSAAKTVPSGYVLAIGGNDLTHVHPIGISYSAAMTAQTTKFGAPELNPITSTFKTSTTLISAQLKASSSGVNDAMECSTCHDIHSMSDRNIPHGQNLCISCHLN